MPRTLPRTHKLLDGTVLSLDDITPEQRVVLIHVMKLARSNAPYFEVERAASTSDLKPKGLVRRVNGEVDFGAAYRAANDIVDRVRIKQGISPSPKDEEALERAQREGRPLMCVAAAARKIGITELEAIRAIRLRKLPAERIGKLTWVREDVALKWRPDQRG